MNKQTLGRYLIFVSRINRDGSGVVHVNEQDVKHCENENFILNRLSITDDTWIAIGFNSYVVKLKNN